MPAAGEVPIECGLIGVADFMNVALESRTRQSMLDALHHLTPSDRVVDRAGHSRPSYRGLLHQWIAFAADAPTPPLHAFVQSATPALAAFAAASGPLGATQAAMANACIFDRTALIALLGRFAESYRTLRGDLLDAIARSAGRVANAQQSDGRFFVHGPSDNPEPLWYAELSMLHGLTPAARDRNAPADVRRCLIASAHYLAAEVQPDHASSHPLAIASLLSIPDGIPLADTMLHVAGVQEPATMDAVSLMLLADALRCGRTAERR